MANLTLPSSGNPWEINPSVSLQTFNTQNTYLDRNIKVKPITISASDVRKGATLYGVSGTFDYPINPSNKSELNLWIET